MSQTNFTVSVIAPLAVEGVKFVKANMRLNKKFYGQYVWKYGKSNDDILIVFIHLDVYWLDRYFNMTQKPWGEYSAYAVVTFISNPCRNFKGGNH